MTTLAKVTPAWKIPMVYLAGGIFGLSDADAKAWRVKAAKLLKKHKVIALDPMDHDYRGREEAEYKTIVRQDLKMLRQVDVVIVNISTAGCGTACELVYAKLWGIPVVGFKSDETKTPSPWVMAHCESILNSLGDACDAAARWVSPCR